MNHGFEDNYDGFPIVGPLASGSLDDIYEGAPIVVLAPTDPPVKASIVSPEDAAGNISKFTALDWIDGGGAFTYNVYFDTVNPPVTQVSTGSAATYYLPSSTLDYEETYYWRIDSVNPYGTTTGDVWSFTVAPLTFPNQVVNALPEDLTLNFSVQGNFTWEDGGGPSWYYDIPNTYDVYFGETLTFIGNQAGLSYDPGVLDYETQYYWRIDVVNPDGTTTGEVMTFSTAPQTPPGQATDPDPADDETDVVIQYFPELSWTPGAYSEEFDVYIDTFNPPTTLRATVSEPAYTWPSMQISTEYYWRVDCKNYDGTTTGVVWHFTTAGVQTLSSATLDEFCDGMPVAVTPTGSSQPLDEWRLAAPAKIFLNLYHGTLPEKVGIVSPPNGSTTASIFSQLEWSDIYDYNNYDVYFGETNPPPFIGNQATTSYDPGQLDYETTYYWRIDPIQEGTREGDVWSFTTLPVTPPEEIVNPSPLDGTIDVAINKILSWEDGGLATSYDVYFGTESGNLTFIGNQVGTTYDPGTLDYDTQYFWRIDPVNFDGTTTGTEMDFTTRDETFFTNPQRRSIIVIT